MLQLRNKFHFTDIHWSMNTTSRMQSKWPIAFKAFHISMDVRKMKFISYIYTLFLHKFLFIICDGLLSL